MKIYRIVVIFSSLLIIISCESTAKKSYFVIKKEFYDNGKLKSVYFMDTLGNGRGKSYHFFFNGTKETDIPYKGKMIDGVCKFYYKGKLTLEEKYLDNKQNGFYINYDSEGKIFEEGQYKNDLQDGLWNYYNNGKLIVSQLFKNGKVVELIYKDSAELSFK